MAAGLRFLLLTAITLLIAGCGFHLRGSVAGSEGLRVALQSATPYGDVERMLASGFRQSGMVGVEKDATPQLVLDLQPEVLTRRVQTVDAYGRASDYELILTYRYRIAAPQALADAETRELVTRREYRFDNRDVLGKAEEEQILVGEMRRDIASRLLRQLHYRAASLAGNPPPATP